VSPAVATTQDAVVEPDEAHPKYNANDAELLMLLPSLLLPSLFPAHTTDALIGYSISNGMKLYKYTFCYSSSKCFQRGCGKHSSLDQNLPLVRPDY
jgi:hypothetical protein